MPHARQWADTFEEGIKAYGFSADQIHHHTDADWDIMHGAINIAREKIRHNARKGYRTHLLCFYAGHAANLMSNLRVFLNSNNRGDSRPGHNQCNLEGWLGACADEKGAYVISLYACDRFGWVPEAKFEESEEEEEYDEPDEEEEKEPEEKEPEEDEPEEAKRGGIDLLIN